MPQFLSNNDPHHAWAYRPQQPRQGAATGPLAGLSFSVKDLFGVAGWPLTASTRAALPPVSPSPLVRRLLELGATAVGKTHLHEIAMGILGEHPYAGEDGATLHPELAGHVAGGSSSGAGVSARLGQVDFALGTDTGGSIRVPSAWCGVYGYKPTKGHPAWPTAGVLPLSQTCDHTGPMAREFSTLVQVQEALTGETVPPANWRGVRVGVWRPTKWLDADILGALGSMAAQLKALGAALRPISLPDMLGAYGPIVTGEAAEVHAKALASADPAFSPDILEKLRAGAALSPAERRAAYAKRQSYQALLAQQFEAIDVILAPITPTLPPKVRQYEVRLSGGERINIRPAVLRLNAPFSMLGLPALAVPTATPWAGVQLVARWNQDTRLLGLVRELAQ